MQKILFSSFLFFLSFLSIKSQCQEANTFTIGKTQTLHSKVLGEDRKLFISIPEKQTQKLPLLLVFDGEVLFEPTVMAMRFMTKASEMPQIPQAVIVGVTNTNRMRDMPIPQEFGKGGEEKFKEFLIKELFPYLNQNFLLNGHCVTIGHSQGGLFNSYLLSEGENYFPWALSLDGPMNIDAKTKKIKIRISNLVNKSNKYRYASVESWYGWEKEWASFFSGNNSFQIKASDEPHESMPYKGIYDGLKLLYNDFSPKRKDLKLSELKSFYDTLSKKYGYPYEIPLKALLASADRKVLEGHKKEILELLQYAEEKYGTNNNISYLRTEALKIPKDPDPLMDHYLNFPKPTAAQVKPYLGRWKGELVVPRGTNMPMDIEIKIEDGEPVLLSVLPWDATKKETPLIFGIEEGKLVFGRKNRGAGVVVAKAVINKNGELEGEQRLIGFIIPEDMPADVKKHMQFILANPNTFKLNRKGD